MTQQALKPLCFLVEDQALIGLSLEAYLDEAGFAIAGPFFTCEEALRALSARRPDVAIIDYMLQDGPCTQLAAALRSAGVPFVVYSGKAADPEVEAPFRDAPWVVKPAARAELMGALARLAPGLVPYTDFRAA